MRESTAAGSIFSMIPLSLISARITGAEISLPSMMMIPK